LESLYSILPRDCLIDLFENGVESLRSKHLSELWNTEIVNLLSFCYLLTGTNEIKENHSNETKIEEKQQNKPPQIEENNKQILTLRSAAFNSMQEIITLILSEQQTFNISEKRSKFRIAFGLTCLLAKLDYLKFIDDGKQDHFNYETAKNIVRYFETMSSLLGLLEIYHCQVECWIFLYDFLRSLPTNHNVNNNTNTKTNNIYLHNGKNLVEDALKQHLLSENKKEINFILTSTLKEQIPPIWIEISEAFLMLNYETLCKMQEESHFQNGSVDSQILLNLIQKIIQMK
jgi:hypothetical protein